MIFFWLHGSSESSSTQLPVPSLITLTAKATSYLRNAHRTARIRKARAPHNSGPSNKKILLSDLRSQVSSSSEDFSSEDSFFENCSPPIGAAKQSNYLTDMSPTFRCFEEMSPIPKDNRTSSPRPSLQGSVCTPELSISNILTSDSELNECNSDNSISNFQENISVSNVLVCANSIIGRHATSDAEASDWFKLIRKIANVPKIPSYETIKRKSRLSSKEKKRHVKQCGDGEKWQLDFEVELKEIVQENIENIYQYNLERNPMTDMKLPDCFDHLKKQLTVYLIFNSDGVKVIKSDNRQMWPVWLAIANLPPIKRSMFLNIVLAVLWFGNNKPDWSVLLPDFEERLKNFPCNVQFQGKEYSLRFKCVLLVADLPARASLLNMIQFNGTYGCNVCLVQTQVDEEKGIRYYPNFSFRSRTTEMHKDHIKEVLSIKLNSYKGVKGPSKLLDIIDFLPLTAPSDCMHQVYLGVTKVLLQVIVSKLAKSNLVRVRSIIDGIKASIFHHRACFCNINEKPFLKEIVAYMKISVTHLQSSVFLFFSSRKNSKGLSGNSKTLNISKPMN